MQGTLLLDVVIRKSSSILQLLSSEDQSLLVWWDSLLVLDLCLDILNGVRWLNLKSDGLASQGLDKDLHTSSEPKDQMQGALLLDVVIGEGSSILKLLSSEDQPLLVWGNSFLILDLGFYVLNGIRRFNLQSDGLASQSLDKDLHTSSQSENKMESAFLLNVVVREGSSIFQLLSSKDQSLLIWGNSFLILDLGFDVLNGIRWFNLQGNGLTSQGLDEDLHTSSQSKNQMQSTFLLDVVIGEGSSIFQLLSGKDQSLLIWGNSFLILDLSLDILNGVGWFDLKGDGFASESLDKDLHTSSQSENQMQGTLLLDVVVGEGSSILELLSSKDQSLLVWRNSFLVLDLGLDILNGVRWFNLKGDGLSSQSLDEDLHTSSQSKNQMQGAFLLDIVIGKGSSIFQLLSSKDQSLLIWGNSFLVLDLGFDVLDGVRRFNLQGDGLASEGLDEDLHTSSQSKHKMEGAFLLDVVIGKSSSVLELLSSEDQPLLVWGNAFLILNLGLHVLNGIRGLDLKSDGFPSKGLNEDLHIETFFVL